MRLQQASIDVLTASSEWSTAAKVAAVVLKDPKDVHGRFISLTRAGYMQCRRRKRMGENGRYQYKEYRITEAGQQKLEEINTPEVDNRRVGTNPFEWRTYAQPVPMAEDKWSNMHKPDTAGKSFVI